MPNHTEIKYGQVGHTKVKPDYGRYTLYKVHEGETKYRKVMHSTDYEDIRPHRHEHAKKWTYIPPEPHSLTKHRDYQRKRNNCTITGDRYGGKRRKAKEAKETKFKPLPIPKTPRPPKVVQTMDATLRAKDKALERILKPEKLEIKEKERPQKVAVQLDSKTSVMVYPEMVEHARERYRQRHKQSQEQSHQQQRQNPNKTKKVKEPQSDLIFFH